MPSIIDMNSQAPWVLQNYWSNQSSIWVLLHYLAKEKSVLFLQSVVNFLQRKRGHKKKNSAEFVRTTRCSPLLTWPRLCDYDGFGVI